MSDWLDLFNAYRVSAQHVASLLLAAAIWRWGGAPERWLIAVFLATMVLPVHVVRWLDIGRLSASPFATWYMLIDLVAAALFIGVALTANRNYPLWIAGFQLVPVGAHLVRALDDSVSPLAIAILVIGPSYCQLLVLTVGFTRHVLRERRFGRYREWRASTRSGGGLSL